MNVSFLKPPIGGIIGLEMITFVEPLGLECVAGALEAAGHRCQILDLRLEDADQAMKKLRAFKPRIVGLQCNFTTERYRALRLAQRVKAEVPGVMVMIGGHDASREPEWFQHPAVDVVAVGDGEEILPAVATMLDRGGRLEDVPGLMLVTPDGPVHTGHAPARGDLDDLPMPARHLIRHYASEYYINFHKPLALLETARGCPFKCNFCSVWKFHESTFREKSPQRVVEELGTIEAPSVFITDDIFWMNVKRGREMAEAIRKSGIRKRFTVQTRTDIICKFPDLVKQWKDCGELSIFLGLEKIDDAGLDSVNKGNSAANNDHALEILRDLGVGYTPNFIVDPSWDHDDFARLREWVAERGAYNSGFSVLTPLPGTDLWDSVKADVVTDDWELFDITHSVLPTKLPLDEFYREYAGLWRHALELRYRIRGRARTYLELLAALASGKVTYTALQKGMNMSKRFSTPDTFLRGHRESPERLRAAAELLAAS